MGIIKKVLKVLYEYGVPIIILLVVCVLFNPTTVLEWVETWVVAVVVLIVVWLIVTTVSNRW